MIEFNYEEIAFDFDEEVHSSWLSKVIVSENKTEGDISYLFCDDDYLLDLNKKFLDQNTHEQEPQGTTYMTIHT